VGGVVVDQLLFRFSICRSVPEIFAIKVESCQKSRKNLDGFLPSQILGGRPSTNCTQVTSFRFWICCLVLEIFAIKVWSGPKFTEILHVFGPQFFGGAPPEFLKSIYKIQPDSDHVAKFQGDRSSDLGESVAKKKKETSRVKHKPVRNGSSGRPNNNKIDTIS